eukprot:scaffold2462_cov121-Isochrysis_galbana.AAC.4
MEARTLISTTQTNFGRGNRGQEAHTSTSAEEAGAPLRVTRDLTAIGCVKHQASTIGSCLLLRRVRVGALPRLPSALGLSGACGVGRASV